MTGRIQARCCYSYIERSEVQALSQYSTAAYTWAALIHDVSARITLNFLWLKVCRTIRMEQNFTFIGENTTDTRDICWAIHKITACCLADGCEDLYTEIAQKSVKNWENDFHVQLFHFICILTEYFSFSIVQSPTKNKQAMIKRSLGIWSLLQFKTNDMHVKKKHSTKFEL